MIVMIRIVILIVMIMITINNGDNIYITINHIA